MILAMGRMIVSSMTFLVMETMEADRMGLWSIPLTVDLVIVLRLIMLMMSSVLLLLHPPICSRILPMLPGSIRPAMVKTGSLDMEGSLIKALRSYYFFTMKPIQIGMIVVLFG